MRKASAPRTGHIGNYWLRKKPGRDGHDGAWCRTWYDARARQTRRVSLGTSDFSEASTQLAEWVVLNGERINADPRDVLIDEILIRYWESHAKRLPSARTEELNLGLWQEYWEGCVVADITPKRQEEFRQWLRQRDTGLDLNEGGLDRILTSGRSALNRAVKFQELASAPFIFMTQTAQARRERTPMGRPLLPAEMAQLLDAARSSHMFLYLLYGICTLLRPGAILDLSPLQYDRQHEIIDANPPGRRQNNKYRPVLPAVPTLRPWLQLDVKGRYISYRGQPIGSILQSFRLTRKAARLAGRVTPYSLRHGMAREMRKRKVPTEQISIFLGHLPSGSDATTAVYAPYEPDYLSEAVAAIEDVLAEIRKHLTRAVIDRPSYAMTISAGQYTGKTSHRGIGEDKRQEVRRLILAGVPHKKVVELTGVAGGTVSAIRKRLRAELPLYRAGDSPICVPLACRDDQIPCVPQMRSEEKRGGPGRT
jgi:integrase